MCERESLLTSGTKGRSYRGAWKNDLHHGAGVRSDGEGRHCGMFQFGQAAGWGTRHYADGSQHMGVWRTLVERELLADGKAVYVQADGFRLLETWRGGKLAGARALRRTRDETDELARRGNEEPRWTEDAAMAGCWVCDALFSLTVRRSHCRSCGVVMCSECTRRVALPWRGDKKPAKCCDDCFVWRNALVAL